ncbi:DALR anticodon-binding domain-containing protein [Sneathiella sp.]|uniref:DALR anticodon-binding domain-containing protein n=1 Tax=Sneathiella sp. TaxID=1964365 RepID=UPI00356A7FF7
MSVSYLLQARKALETALEGVEFADEAARARVAASIFLRPPKPEGRADLCTNAAILLKSNKYISFDEPAVPFLAAFRALDGVSGVTLASNGYINITYAPKFWQSSLPVICREQEKFGLEGAGGREIHVKIPATVNDLASARAAAAAAVLGILARLSGGSVVEETLPPRPAEGFPLAAAIAKCNESRTRFALLANPVGFVAAFSPILAIDKSYNNPVFCLPYALAQVRRCLGRAAETGNNGEIAVEMPVLTLPIEVKLAKSLCGWPIAVDRALEKTEAFYFAAFLQEVCLLFFALAEKTHPVSSGYLTEAGAGQSRICLFAAVETVLSAGLKILGVQNLKGV